MNTKAVDQTIAWRLARTGLFIGGLLLLLGTWVIMYYWILGATEGWLVPWDCWPVSYRPAVGTWARTVNDFFESRPGSILPSIAVVAIGVCTFIVRVARTRDRTLLPVTFAATNLVFLVADLFLVIFAHLLPNLWLPKPRPEVDIGYHHTWPAILVTIVLLTVLFVVQSKITLAKDRGRP